MCHFEDVFFGGSYILAAKPDAAYFPAAGCFSTKKKKNTRLKD